MEALLGPRKAAVLMRSVFFFGVQPWLAGASNLVVFLQSRMRLEANILLVFIGSIAKEPNGGILIDHAA